MKIIQLGAGRGNDHVTQLINQNKTDFVLLVEANPLLIPELENCYKNNNVIIVNKAIVPTKDTNTITLYYSDNNAPQYDQSSIDKNHLLKIGHPEESIHPIEIECCTIESLLDEYSIKELDYLFMDLEGIDADVVLNFNMDKYFIKNIQFEYTHITDQSEKIIKKFTENSYIQSNAIDYFSSDVMFTKVGQYLPQKPSIDIILRTHSFIDIHPNPTPRYCGADKTTLVEKCVKSLVQSANNYTGEIKFIWFDDHSSQDMIDKVFKVFTSSKHPVEFNALEQRGWNASGLAQFDQGRGSKADLVYFVEDDYLHYPTAIEEMVDAYLTFKRNLGSEVAIHPYDDPDNYLPLFIDECRIVLGVNRHWRTNKYSTFTFMCSPDIVRKFWSRFYTVATEYMTEWGEKNQIQEGTTINHIWRWEIKLFTPIPSVALHMGYERQLDKYIDWKALWDSVG